MPQSEVMDYRDTESRVEIILNQSLAFVDANASIRVLCQALSLDEHHTRETGHRPGMKLISRM